MARQRDIHVVPHEEGGWATIAALAEAAKRFGLAEHGDPVERAAKGFLDQQLPQYEPVWQLFTFPFRDNGSVWIKRNLHRAHEAVVIYHYSVLRSSLRTFRLYREAHTSKIVLGEVGSDLFYDCCIWLGVTYERLGQQAGALYRYLMQPENVDRKGIRDWEDHRDSFGEWLGGDIWTDLWKARDAVSKYRNNIIHGIKFPGGRDRIPVEDQLDEFLYWSRWMELVQSGAEVWRSKTVDRLELLDEFWTDFAKVVDAFWGTTLKRVNGEMGDRRFVDHNLAELQIPQASPPAGLIRQGDIAGVSNHVPSGEAWPRLSSDTTYPPGE